MSNRVVSSRVSLFVAGAAFGDVQVSLFLAGAALGDVQVSLFVAGAVLGEVQVSLFILQCHFSWQVQYLGRLDSDTCCSAHWK